MRRQQLGGRPQGLLRQLWIRPRAPAALIAVALVACSYLVLVSPASTKPEAGRSRRYPAFVIGDVFERFFFAQWLGVSMSLRGAACPAEQLHEAIADKGKFPSSFERRTINPNIASPLCRAVEFRFDDRNNMQLALRVPNLSSCDAYVEKWKGFSSATSMKHAIEPYKVSEDSYDKYNIAKQARPIWRVKSRFDAREIEKIDLSSVLAFRLANVSDRDGFCRFEFRYEGPAWD
jgi:hypothetical protein